MITAPQIMRLRDIISDIEHAERHPSPNVQVAYAKFTPQEWQAVIEFIKKTLAEDDGYRAHRIISGWHGGGIVAVAPLCLPIAKSTEIKIV